MGWGAYGYIPSYSTGQWLEPRNINSGLEKKYTVSKKKGDWWEGVEGKGKERKEGN